MSSGHNTVGVIVPAAGKGVRLGAGTPKQLMDLAGKPLLVHALGFFQELPAVGRIVVAAPADLTGEMETIFRRFGLSKIVAVVGGGAERQDSVYNGLKFFAADPPELVLIHDAVRPFPDGGTVQRVLDAAALFGAAVPAMIPKETVKIASEDLFVRGTLPRDELRAVQTPQGFRFQVIFEAYRKAAAEQRAATDDASLVESAGGKVKIVEGNYENIKVTTPEDLELAEIICRTRSGCESCDS
ncbi:MAG TPA: 2-C-methyl-D-erythritol 4-phosphate cytidylyltransferase [Bacteroidota bacterium]|nr:2-C-methyl-D-erythritol 4-phosphate cytidylyltransferase [Bacteroidota bacterium]